MQSFCVHEMLVAACWYMSGLELWPIRELLPLNLLQRQLVSTTEDSLSACKGGNIASVNDEVYDK